MVSGTFIRRETTMRDDTKLARIRQAMQVGDWDAAIKLAARFQRLGPQDEAIKRAANAINNPSFYIQLGQDPERLKQAGIAALKERFDKSWQSVMPKITRDQQEE
jgi:hypothetical protein